jgi:hypothetical protein
MMPMSDNAACVLVYGRDSTLLATRAQVIRAGGFCTCEAKTDSEFLERLKPRRCAALVLCHTLSEGQAGWASQLAKQKIPTIKIIAMAQSSPAVDASLGSFVRPKELLAVLERTILH